MKFYHYAITATVALITTAAYSVYRDNKAERAVVDAIDEKYGAVEAEDSDAGIVWTTLEQRGPKFDVGDPVIIADPADMQSQLLGRGKITARKPEGDYGYIDVYQIDDAPIWVNENWLHHDTTGPYMLPPAPDLTDTPAADYWLATLHDALEAGDEAGATHAKAELKQLTQRRTSQ